MAKVYATPGVYIEEKSAFPNSAVPVATAVPAFIGYTQKAIFGKMPLKNVPTKISSYNEFVLMFGGAPSTTYSIEKVDETTELRDVRYKLTPKDQNFILHNCMRMFFANGGSDCYIISVGTYDEGDKKVVGKALQDAILLLKKEPEPTMLVIPEAVLDREAYPAIMVSMLNHCGMVMKNRVSILDIIDGDQEITPALDPIENFRNDVGMNFLQWGAAYYPWLETTVVSSADLNFRNFANIGAEGDIVDFLPNPNAGQPNEAEFIMDEATVTAQKTTYEGAPTLIGLLDLNLNIDFMDNLIPHKRAQQIKDEIKKLAAVAKPDEKALHQALLAVSPAYKEVLNDLKSAINTLPPSAAMAGIYSMVDNTVGVYQSPANVSVGSVVKPVVNLTNEQQEDLNLPLTGKAVNAIRTFPGKGVLVWGARTLDGNSQDWRYISVRRTVIFIEQSIKYAAEAYVFEPNVSATWTNLRALITNFLTNVWQQGALAGATPEDAFSVDVGLGSTMTPVDILDGIMRITVKIAVTRPAEFIVITFQQQMQKS
jgi:phage tail sheath protein FI